jgi:CubicO group peptidase (beta-lactamase class C family)
MTFARRLFLQGSAGLAASLLAGRLADAADGDAIRMVQNRIDLVARNAFRESGARVAIVAGIVTPDNAGGQLLFAGRDTLVNPFGTALVLDERTPFEIGSVSKVFTSGIHYMLRGPYEGTLGESLGRRMPLSKAMADIRLRNLANYEPGLAQDNQGGVYPAGMMKSLSNLFTYMTTFSPPAPQGTCYAYSNIGWSLLSMASLEIDNTDTEAFVAAYDRHLRQFCAGFGAPDTTVFRSGMKPHLPIGHTARLAPLAVGDDYQPSNPPGFGSGGIVSNGADMLRYLLYNMGRLARGPSDPALAYQQTETFKAAACSAKGGAPVTSYGWFHAPVQTAQGPAIVLNKNGGVAGFTSWMGFTQWQGTGKPSPHGVFVLSNGPRSTAIGMNTMKLLLRR